MSLRGVVILYRPDDIYTNKFKYYDEVDSMDELGLIMIYRAYIQGTAHECALKLAEDDLFNVNNTEEIKFNSLLRCTRKFLRESIDELFDPHQILNKFLQHSLKKDMILLSLLLTLQHDQY